MGPTSGGRIQNRLPQYPSAESHSRENLCRSPNGPPEEGDRSSTVQGYDCPSLSRRPQKGQGVPLHAFPAPKKGREPETRHQSTEPESVCQGPTFQDRRHAVSEGHIAGTGLVNANRPQGRVLCGADTQRPPKFPALHMAKHQLPVHLPAIWTLYDAQGMVGSVNYPKS